jgi:hypothetical protein
MKKLMKTKLAILTLAAVIGLMGCKPQADSGADSSSPTPGSANGTPPVPEAPATPDMTVTNAPAPQP